MDFSRYIAVTAFGLGGFLAAVGAFPQFGHPFNPLVALAGVCWFAGNIMMVRFSVAKTWGPGATIAVLMFVASYGFQYDPTLHFFEMLSGVVADVLIAVLLISHIWEWIAPSVTPVYRRGAQFVYDNWRQMRLLRRR